MSLTLTVHKAGHGSRVITIEETGQQVHISNQALRVLSFYNINVDQFLQQACHILKSMHTLEYPPKRMEIGKTSSCFDPHVPYLALVIQDFAKEVNGVGTT